MKKQKKLSYSQVGDNYDTKDPIKKLAQTAAKKTAANLTKHGFSEIADSRGESAFVWSLGSALHQTVRGSARDKDAPLMAAVIEGLGTKNLVADAMREVTGKTYYDVIGHDTVATIINDLVTVGAAPLVVHAYWAVQDNSWLQDEKRMKDLINGWKTACDVSGATWGGGETPTMKGILLENTAELGGSAVGIISSKKNLITDKKLKAGDRILLCRSNGINANGLSLARAIAKKLPNGYATKLASGKLYGETLLTKTNIYAALVQDLLNEGVAIHYISNITGHGLRKIMRAKPKFSYVLEDLFEPQEVFGFMQIQANLSDKEMYGTFNMGQDYCLFIPEKDVKKAQSIIAKHKFQSLEAGFVKKGEKQVVIKPKNIVFKEKSLDLR